MVPSSSKNKNFRVNPTNRPTDPTRDSNFPMMKEGYEEASLLSPSSGTFKTLRQKLHLHILTLEGEGEDDEQVVLPPDSSSSQ